MIPSRAFACATLGALVVGGCVTYPSAEETFSGVQDMVGQRGLEHIVWNRGSEADDEVARSVHELLARELTVDAAVQVALLNNRELQATYEDLGIAQADLVQAGLLSNPFLMVEVRFPSHPKIPLEIDVGQDFLDVLLRPLRQRVGTAEFEGARQRVADAVVQLGTRVRVAFFALQGAEQVRDLRSTVAYAAEASADAARRLHDAGNVTDLALANEQAELGQARLDLAQAEADEAAAREDLTVLLGLWGEDAKFTLAPKLPDLPKDEVSSENLESLAMTQRLDLAAVWSDVRATALALGLQDYAALQPGVEASFHVEREPDGTTTSGPSLSIPIPVFDTGRAARERAQAMFRQNQQRYAALAVEIRSSVRRVRDRMLAARNRAQFYRDDMVPLRTAIVDQTQLEYNAMLVGVFQLVQAKQAEIDAGRSYVEALQDYWIARAELQAAVGGRFESAAVPPQPEPETPAQPTPPEPEHTEHHHPGA